MRLSPKWDLLWCLSSDSFRMCSRTSTLRLLQQRHLFLSPLGSIRRRNGWLWWDMILILKIFLKKMGWKHLELCPQMMFVNSLNYWEGKLDGCLRWRALRASWRSSAGWQRDHNEQMDLPLQSDQSVLSHMMGILCHPRTCLSKGLKSPRDPMSDLLVSQNPWPKPASPFRENYWLRHSDPVYSVAAACLCFRVCGEQVGMCFHSWLLSCPM